MREWKRRTSAGMQMRLVQPDEWQRPRPSRWLDRMRGTGRRARRARLAFTLGGGIALVFSGLVMAAGSLYDDRRLLGLGLVLAGIGLAALVLVLLTRPIAKVTFRAWVAGWWYARRVRRHAANASGHPSARARRAVTNKAAWAAQRQRSGRAARPEYGSSLRRRMVEPKPVRRDPAREGADTA